MTKYVDRVDKMVVIYKFIRIIDEIKCLTADNVRTYKYTILFLVFQRLGKT